MPTVTFHMRDNVMGRFETIKTQGNIEPYTIVRVKKTPNGTFYTVKKMKWSKYKFINRLIRIYTIIRYW